MRGSMTPTLAETIALKGLAFLANSPEELGRFASLTGADGTQLRDGAADPEFLAAVLDYLLTDDSRLTNFCASESLEPRAVHSARHALPGG
jgi:hypothetical protein